MSSTSRAWLVAASVAAVEALKDQGYCRWTYTIRSIHQYAKTHVTKSISQANKGNHSNTNTSKNKKLPSSSSSSAFEVSSSYKNLKELEKTKKFEESFRTVLYLSSWGPY